MTKLEHYYGLFGNSYLYETDLQGTDLFQMAFFEIDVVELRLFGNT